MIDEITMRADRLLDEVSKLHFNLKMDKATGSSLEHLRCIQSIARKIETLIENKLKQPTE